jgi:sec-independent protein translocase protein TatA
MLGGIGPWELVLILLVVLLLFGAKRLPEIAKGLGKGIRDFKAAMRDTSDELKGGPDGNDRQIPTPKSPYEGHKPPEDGKPT